MSQLFVVRLRCDYYERATIGAGDGLCRAAVHAVSKVNKASNAWAALVGCQRHVLNRVEVKFGKPVEFCDARRLAAFSQRAVNSLHPALSLSSVLVSRLSATLSHSTRI